MHQPGVEDVRRVLRAASLGVVIGLGATFLAPEGAFAQTVQAESDDGEALLTADAVLHDEEAGTITASGNVEVAYGERVLRADEIIYYIARDVIVAQGNVALVDPGGDVVFADRAEVTSDLDEALVNQVRALMRESSRVTAANAIRTGGNQTVFNKGRFTPCSTCTFGRRRTPMAPELTSNSRSRRAWRDATRGSTCSAAAVYTLLSIRTDRGTGKRPAVPSFGRTFQGFYKTSLSHVIDETSDIT